MIRAATVLLGICLLVGCGGGDDPTAPRAFTGTYSLRSVNGSSLPYVVAQSGPNTVSILSDQIVIADGGSWSEVTLYRVVDNAGTREQTVNDGGTWVRTGDKLALYQSGSASTGYIGTIARNTLTFNDGTLVQVFSK